MSDVIERTFASIQHCAISEVLHLFDGFYENLEHGLFELAYHLEDPTIQGRCAVTMKELRLQKGKIVQKFTNLMQADQTLWMTASSDHDSNEDLCIEARTLALKYDNHFNAVHSSLKRRVALATGRDDAEVEIPIRPERLTCHFLHCMCDVREDPDISPMLNDLFGRLVLDRLGSLYGQINSRLFAFEQDFAKHRAEVA